MEEAPSPRPAGRWLAESIDQRRETLVRRCFSLAALATSSYLILVSAFAERGVPRPAALDLIAVAVGVIETSTGAQARVRG